MKAREPAKRSGIDKVVKITSKISPTTRQIAITP
jgi:hypothetical protein